MNFGITWDFFCEMNCEAFTTITIALWCLASRGRESSLYGEKEMSNASRRRDEEEVGNVGRGGKKGLKMRREEWR